MKRTAMKRGKGFKPRLRVEAPTAEKEPRPMAKLVRQGNYARADIGIPASLPKTEAYRDPALLEMARDRICLLCLRGFCVCTPGSVVACHSNWARHGKAKSRKADDCYSVWGGDFAHNWLDRGAAMRSDKEATFTAAHLRQVEAWRIVADDPGEPERFRKAARRALEWLAANDNNRRAA